MAEHSHIEWTDATWNPITGCSVVSPGCTNCYAMKLAGTRLQLHPSRAGLTTDSKAGPVWNGQVRLNEDWLTQPLQWKRPRRIFVCAHGDLFHESVPDAWIDRVFAVMALAPQHTFQVLTKRAARMRAYMAERWQPAPARRLEGFGLPPIDLPAEREGEDRHDQVARIAEQLANDIGLLDPENDALWTDDGASKAMSFAWPLPNVWLGVSAEDQARADERIPDLLATPAAVRFLSAEPLLGPIDLNRIVSSDVVGSYTWSSLVRPDEQSTTLPRLDWVIVGGESGPGARPMHPDWARQIRDDCAAAGVPFFFKQWGGWAPGESITGYSPNLGGHYDDDQNRWDFTVYSPAAIEGLHIDEEPAVWSVSKKAAGRTLDGVTHDAMPGDAR